MRSRSRRGARPAAGVAAVVAVLVGLWVLSARSISPDQRLAEAEPPPAATVDVELEQRVLNDTILVRGQVAVRSRIDVMAPGVAGAAGGGGGEGAPVGVAILGELPYRVGEEVPPGGVVAVVSDRPVLVMPMSLPMHRLLGPGDEGPDVKRLQQALQKVGYDVAVDGEFGDRTQQAVRRLYQERGHEPLTTGPELDEAVEAAEDALEEAETAVQDAEDAWAAALATGDQQQIDAARPPLVDALEAHAAATEAREEAEAAVGVIVPLGELVGVAELPVVVSRLPVAVGRPVTEGPVAVLSPSDLVVRAPADETQMSLLQPGLSGTATVEGEDVSFEVEVVDPGDASGSGGDGAAGAGGGGGDDGGAGGAADGAPSTVLAPVDAIDPGLLGKPVVVEVVLAATDGEVLAVPTGAVRADGDGEYLLLVDGEDGDEDEGGGVGEGEDGDDPDRDDGDGPRRVGFSPGLSIGGWVEVTDPEVPLAAGDVVRAG